ncbi:MAG: hypothetical protein LBH98_08320 [Chitinispirillales bacterium]|nr:hypothetical protein [Chitinispirillales bacterium]
MNMLIRDLGDFPEFETVLLGNSVDEEAKQIIVSELMSDVLTEDNGGNVVLITGLCTEQAIRTSNMVDALAVVITAGKKITASMIKIANDAKISLFSTKLRNYEVCKLIAGKM